MNEQITKYLEYYIDIPEPPQFAVLISGDWGSGKSFFVRKFIDEHPTYKYLYISLYGVTSTKDVTDQMFEQLHPTLASAPAKLIRKLGTGLLKGALKIDLTKDSSIDLDPEIAKLELPSYLTKAGDRVLIFDDLERCPMKITNILGYINQFVESNGHKVIIVANENEIRGSKQTKDQGDKESEPSEKKTSKYLRTKEKLIGRTFLLETDVEQAATSFFKSVRNDELKKYISTNREAIIVTYGDSGYNNLRYLKQTILDLDRFFEILPTIAFQKPELVDELVRTFIALSFELKAGRHPEEIQTLYAGVLLEDGKDGTLLKTLNDKYSIRRVPISVTLWYDFFSKGAFKHIHELVLAISNSEYFADENTPAEIKLWQWWDLDDSIFIEVLKKVTGRLTDGSIDNQFLLSHIVSTLMDLSKEKLCPLPYAHILQSGKANVDRLGTEGKLVVHIHDDISLGAFAGKGFRAKDIPEFIEYYDYLKAEAAQNAVRALANEANTLLHDLEVNPLSFTNQIIIGNSREVNKYYDKPILASIPVSDFVQKYLNLKNADKRIVNHGLSKRYHPLIFLNDLKPELSWLETVRASLDKEAHDPDRTVSKTMLTYAVSILDESIANLTAVSHSPASP